MAPFGMGPLLIPSIDCDDDTELNDGLPGGGADEEAAKALVNAARGDTGDICGSGIRGDRIFWFRWDVGGSRADSGEVAAGAATDMIDCVSLLPEEMNEGLAVPPDENEFIVSLELAAACLAK